MLHNKPIFQDMVPWELIKSKQFVEKPVNKILRQIKNNNSNRMFLIGCNGSGKDICLAQLEEKTIGTRNPVINTYFCLRNNDISDTYIKNDKQERYLIHCLELKMCSQLITYIKNNYPRTYYKKFLKLDKFISHTKLHVGYLESGEIIIKIINMLKKKLGFKTVTVAFADYEHCNKIIQTLLNSYADYFDKTIITSNQTYLTVNDNCNININYNLKLKYIKQIVEKRIKIFNDNNDNTFINNKIITDDMYYKLINVSQGNISSIINILNYAIGLTLWNYNFDKFDEYFDDTIEKYLKKNQQYKKQIK